MEKGVGDEEAWCVIALSTRAGLEVLVSHPIKPLEHLRETDGAARWVTETPEDAMLIISTEDMKTEILNEIVSRRRCKCHISRESC
ncbi:hypothetical protein RRG08_067227 [Elysia crispata]|uniref:Uncharacterized protein n=1 Tax=Elysia crispata TaxID=231223 RepID=A0AAE1AA42_9GAST|nr:hypothetical protein RRG08_067227 [Elysia crispata]